MPSAATRALTVPAAEALALIPAGATMVCPPGLGAPPTLLAALDQVAPGRCWTLASGLLLGEYPFLDLVRTGELAYLTWHVMAPVRPLVANGAVGYLAVRASLLADVLATRGVDAALVRITPPDRNGYCSLGPSASYSLDVLRLASVRIGEVDPTLPWTLGRTTVPISTFHALVEAAKPGPEYRSAQADQKSQMIADHVFGLLPRDPTIQIGIGAIPEAVVSSLGKTDLGRIRFAGMVTDEMVDLFEGGVIDVSAVDDQPAILSPELMGTERLMRFADRNPAVALYPSTTSHSPALLARSPRFVSINTAIEVDLSGQVNSETVKGRQVSGVGGSLDFIDAAGRSEGGLRVIAVPSTTPDGSKSRIVAGVGPSNRVTVPRSMVDVVVTEFGIARLAGLTGNERARALTAIAHPDHRAELAEAAADA